MNKNGTVSHLWVAIELLKGSIIIRVLCFDAIVLIITILICWSILNKPDYKTKVESAKAPPPAFISKQSLGFFEVTAYCTCEKCCGKWSDGHTASGHIIQADDKFCAADPIFPFGTMLVIPGYGYVPVLDRGGAIKGNKLDVFFPTHQEALNWGRRKLEIFI